MDPSQSASPGSSPPVSAGWYPDPWQPGYRRYWDGERWTADAFPESLVAPAATGRWVFGGQNGAGAHDRAAGPPGWSWQPAVSSAPHVPPGIEPATTPPPPPSWASPGSAPPEPWSSPLPEPAAPAASSRWPQVLIGLFLVVALVAGYVAAVEIRHALHHSSKSSALGPVPTTPTNPATPTTAPTPTDPSVSVLRSLVLQQADVTTGVVVQPLRDGETLGVPTLDLCNGTFPSEGLRTARLQVIGEDVQTGSNVQTEAVLYKDPASATQAMDELSKAKNDCPGTPVVSPIGNPSETTKFNPAPDGGWPQVAGVQRAAYDYNQTDAGGDTSHTVEVFLRRGRALLGIYFAPDDPLITVQGQTTVAGTVNVFAERMAQLPGSAIGA